MVYLLVQVLHFRDLYSGHLNEIVAQFYHIASILTGETYRNDVETASCYQRIKNVFGASGCADPDKYIRLSPVPIDLLSENHVCRNIV